MKNIIYFLNDSRQVYQAGHVLSDRLAWPVDKKKEKKKEKKIKVILLETKKTNETILPLSGI